MVLVLFSTTSTPPLLPSPPLLRKRLFCSRREPPSKTCSDPALLRRFPSAVPASSSAGTSCSSRPSFVADCGSFLFDSSHLSADPPKLPCSSQAFPEASRKTHSSCLPISRKQKMRSSFSERLMMNRGEEVSSSVAASNHDTLLPSENVDDDNGKLIDGKPLPMSESKILTLPTILTLGRMAAIPILLVVFYSTEWWASKAVASIFVLAAITDWLDGFLARKMGSNSTFGAFLDPVADKLMVATTLVLLSTKPLHISWAASLPWLIPLPSTAIIGREITMSAVREWAASQGEKLQAAVAVNKLGKWKTAFQMVALTVLLATRNGSESGTVYVLVSVGVGLLYISAALAIWSLFVYIKAIWGALVR